MIAALLAVAPAAHAANLEQLYRLALRNDPVYRSAAASLRSTAQAVPQARAALLPNLSFSAGVTANQLDVRSSARGSFTTDYAGHTLELSLTQPLYHRDLWVALGQAHLQVREAEMQYAAARQTLIVSLANAYFGVLNAIENLQFSRANQQSIGQQLQQAQQRFKVGLIAITDVEQLKAAFDLARAETIQSENALAQAREALRVITGQYTPKLAPLGKRVPLIMPKPDDIDQWTRTALRQNLQLQAARLASRVAREQITRIESRHLPTLDLVGSHARVFNGGGLFGESNTWTSTIGVQLKVPIYTGGLILSQTRQSRALYDKALDQQESIRRQVQQQTRNAFLGVETGISRVKALRQAVKSNETALAAAQAGFEVGTQTSVDVLKAQSDLTQARFNYASARYGYVEDLLALKQAAGTLSEADLARVNSWLVDTR